MLANYVNPDFILNRLAAAEREADREAEMKELQEKANTVETHIRVEEFYYRKYRETKEENEKLKEEIEKLRKIIANLNKKNTQ